MNGITHDSWVSFAESSYIFPKIKMAKMTPLTPLTKHFAVEQFHIKMASTLTDSLWPPTAKVSPATIGDVQDLKMGLYPQVYHECVIYGYINHQHMAGSWHCFTMLH